VPRSGWHHSLLVGADQTEGDRGTEEDQTEEVAGSPLITSIAESVCLLIYFSIATAVLAWGGGVFKDF
jgi:hypothetical protein